MNEEGSTLVETIGMIALTVLLTIGLINLTAAIYVKTRLTSAATLAARTGAINSELARSRLRQELGGTELSGEMYGRKSISGQCFFEVKVESPVSTILGVRTVSGRGHALCEG